MKKLLFIFGTRPEAIKMAPLIKLFSSKSQYKTVVCVTGQHRQMLDQVLDFFEISPDYDLDVMQQDQTLYSVTAKIISSLEKVFKAENPEYVFVQGDTTTAFAGALAGFYNKSKVIHIEAGLRSGNNYSPFPEEINRKLTGSLADFHFAPTPKAAENLTSEGITKNVWITGNTVIDALLFGLMLIEKRGDHSFKEFFSFLNFNKKIILVTGHRRESFGDPFRNIFQAIHKIAIDNPDVEIVYPVHLNPNVQKPVKEILGNIENVHLIEPLDYSYLIWLLNKSYLVITDSGGIQEEAPSLGKPVLVLREVTERQEGVDAGTALLVGADFNKIVAETENLLHNKEAYFKMANALNPYGDGKSCEEIERILYKNIFKDEGTISIP